MSAKRIFRISQRAAASAFGVSVKIINLSDAAALAGQPTLDHAELASLDQRLIEMVARNSAQADLNKRAQIAGLGDAAQVTNPAHLHAMQVEMAEYSVKIAMINAYVRKGVAAVETLLKS